RAGEWSDKGELAFLDVGESGQAQRGAGVADQRQDAALLDQDPGIVARALRVVGVVERDQLDLPAVDAAGIVDLLEIRLQPLAYVVAELLVAAGERRRLPDQDGRLRHTLREGAAPRQAGKHHQCRDERAY